MKRIGRIWPGVISMDNGMQAVIDGTRYKRSDKEVRKLLYDEDVVNSDRSKKGKLDPEKVKNYVSFIIEDLGNRQWRHSRPRYKKEFCRSRASNGGKWRDLYIPSLEDHIVGHMVMNVSMPAFTRGMHPHCCGSVPGRGVKHILETVDHWLKDDKQCRYFVKLDIRHFFDNIDTSILMRKLREKIKDKYVIDIFSQIIHSAPIACPVGYYTSPWLANLYLQDLDWFIEQNLYTVRRGKRIKCIRHYLRYVDDMLLIGTNKSDIKYSIKQICSFLRSINLFIKPTWEIKRIGTHELVNGKWKLKPDTYWCDIGGYKFCKDATILRDGVYLSTKRLVRKMSKQGYYTIHQCQSFNSKLGWASKCDSNHFIENDVRPYVDIKTTRRIISNVDKKREQRQHDAVKI